MMRQRLWGQYKLTYERNREKVRAAATQWARKNRRS